jgi:hypothetical protein
MIVDLLSDAALIHASSPKVFERGKTYASSGAVSAVSEEGDPKPVIHAEVAGTQLYATSVWIEDGEGNKCQITPWYALVPKGVDCSKRHSEPGDLILAADCAPRKD